MGSFFTERLCKYQNTNDITTIYVHYSRRFVVYYYRNGFDFRHISYGYQTQFSMKTLYNKIEFFKFKMRKSADNTKKESIKPQNAEAKMYIV